MSNQSVFTSVQFGISDYQVACSIEQKRLKIAVSCLNQKRSSALNLSQFLSFNQTITFQVSIINQQEFQSSAQKNNETEEQKVKNEFLMRKLEQLQRNYRSLENKMQTYSDQRQELWKLTKNEQKNIFTPNQTSSPKIIFNKSKNQHRTNKLGEIISEKEQQIYFLQRKVNERDELVRELADGLMAANSEKEEIFNQYQRMLQAVVFRKVEEEVQVPVLIEEKLNPSNQATQYTKCQLLPQSNVTQEIEEQNKKLEETKKE